jgi:hypothetical protein
MANIKEARMERAAKKFEKSIPDRTVRMFRVFIEESYPEGTVFLYQSESFTANIDGKEETTCPDLKIVRPGGKKIIRVELTKSKRNGTDPKERERKIMKQKAPNDIFVALYCDNLKRIQTKHKDGGLNLFKVEKKKKTYRNKPLASAPQPIKVPHATNASNKKDIFYGHARSVSRKLNNSPR